MKTNIIDLAVYRKNDIEPAKPKEPPELDELSHAILLLIQRLKDCNPLKQTG